MFSRSTASIMAVVALAIVFAIAVRITHMPAWQETPQRAYLHDGRPVLIEFDGYFYLRYARDLIEGSYQPIDHLRNYPSGLARPIVPPLLSLLIAWVQRGTGLSLDLVGAWMPVVVAAASVVSFYALGAALGGSLAGCLAAFAPSLSPFFITRSQFAHLDTDCGIPGLLALMAFFALQVGSTLGHRSNSKPIIACLLLAATVALLAIWWHTAAVAVFGFGGALLITALIGYQRRRILLRCLVVSLAALLACRLFTGLAPWSLLEQALSQFSRVTSAETEVISEQIQFSLAGNIAHGYGHELFFASVVVGLLLLIWFRPLRLLSILPLVLAAGLPMLWYHRFHIFTPTIIALGLSGLAVLVQHLDERSRSLAWFALLLVGALLASWLRAGYSTAGSTIEWPVVSPASCYALERFGGIAPPDSLVWSWWDNGYHIQYFARRATLEDNGNFRIPEINALPLLVDEKTAAAWMHWVAGIGSDRARHCLNQYGSEHTFQFLTGRADAVSLPIDSSLQNCFPPGSAKNSLSPPITLFLNNLYLHTAHWWVYYGNRIFTGNARHGRLQPFYHIRSQAGRLQLDGGQHYFSKKSGLLSSGGVAIGTALIKEEKTVGKFSYQNNSSLVLLADLDNDWAALLDDELLESLFIRLYFLPRRKSGHFVLLATNTPQFQLWDVRWP